MTSSLVGSEMCIRDRVSDTCLEAATLHRLLFPQAERERPTLDDKLCAKTVSYTHLTLPTICSV
eukprot:897112-Prorocentrum_lima.AAC.1